MSGKERILQSTLEQLEHDRWGEPNFDSFLVKRTHALRKIPLNKFTIEDLRLMIGQSFSLDYLMPLALDVLMENVMAEGDYYPGDLLQSVLKASAQFWQHNGELWRRLDLLLTTHGEILIENNIDCSHFYANRPR